MSAQVPVPGCSRHPGMGFVYLCLDCKDELLCTRCVVDTHKRHNFVVIEDLVSDKKVELQKYIDKVSNNDNPNLQREIKVTENQIKENGRHFKKMIANVKDHAQKMKNMINKLTEKLVELCCELEKSNEEMLNSYKTALEHLKDQNDWKIKDLQKTLESGTIMEVVKKATETRSKSGGPPVLGKLKLVQFHPGHLSVPQFEHVLGFVTMDGQDMRYRPSTKLKVVSEFKHKSFLDTCRATQDNAWLSHWEDEEIYRVDQKGKVKETIQCKVNVGRITIAPTTGRVWFCCCEDNTVREILDKDTVVTRFVTDNEPRSLCITTNKTVVVGMVGKIVIYTTEGQEVKSVGGGGPCRREAVVPWYIAHSTETGDIVAADSENVVFNDYVTVEEPGKQPHIKLMDKYLNLRFRYPSREKKASEADDKRPGGKQRPLFYPYDVCFGLAGDILVSDGVTKSVVQIEEYRRGYINVRTIHTDNDIPRSICLQTDGTLWVGLSNNRVKVLKYK